MMRRVACARIQSSAELAIRQVLDWVQWETIVPRQARVCVKPNLTFPRYKPGVTTSPEVLRGLLTILKERTSNIAVVETDGGYGTWKANDAFAAHGYDQMCADLGVELVNLSEEPADNIRFESNGRQWDMPLPKRLLRQTDVLVNMPVPKVHAMTYLSLAYKNLWGCVPDSMRLRRHFLLNDALVAINRALAPKLCIGDGSFFLDRQGPMDGDAVPMNLIIAATDSGAFSLYTAHLMRMDWRRAPHLRRAAELGDMPSCLDQLEMNAAPEEMSTRAFHLRRSLRNYLVLPAFRSSRLTWLYYESSLGLLLHRLLYAIAGRMQDTPSRVVDP